MLALALSVAAAFGIHLKKSAPAADADTVTADTTATTADHY